MSKKYTLVKSDFVINWDGKRLYRIKAKVAIAALGIAAGTLGGYVEKEGNLSQVSGDAWVYGDAWVSGDAQVSGNAQVFGNARVFGNAQVSGDAWVYGDAWVSGDAQVSGNAQVFGNARVFGNAQVFGNARVFGNAQVSGNAQVFGDARVYGNAQVFGDARVSGVNLIAVRSDGYTFLVAPTTKGPRIMAGCRYFSFDEAEKHWRDTRGGTPLGDETFDILELLKKQAERHGFMEPVALIERERGE